MNSRQNGVRGWVNTKVTKVTNTQALYSFTDPNKLHNSGLIEITSTWLPIPLMNSLVNCHPVDRPTGLHFPCESYVILNVVGYLVVADGPGYPKAQFTQHAEAHLHVNPSMLTAMLCEHCPGQCVPSFAWYLLRGALRPV